MRSFGRRPVSDRDKRGSLSTYDSRCATAGTRGPSPRTAWRAVSIADTRTHARHYVGISERDPAEPRRLGNSIRQRGTDVTSEGRAQAHRWVSKAELTRGIQIEPHWRTTATAPSKDSRCAWLIGPFAGRIPTNSRPAGGGSCSIVDSWGVHVNCAARSWPELEGTQYGLSDPSHKGLEGE